MSQHSSTKISSSFTVILLAFILSASFSACKKDSKPVQPPAEDLTLTQWQIDSLQFSTHQVFVDSAAGSITLSGTDKNSNFGVTFYQSTFPSEGNFLVNCDGSAANACLQVSYKTKTYRENPIKPGIISLVTVNGQTSVQLAATTFYNTDGTSDSVMVSGIFRIP